MPCAGAVVRPTSPARKPRAVGHGQVAKLAHRPTGGNGPHAVACRVGTRTADAVDSGQAGGLGERVKSRHAFAGAVHRAAIAVVATPGRRS
jgi:hypothetical protein